MSKWLNFTWPHGSVLFCHNYEAGFNKTQIEQMSGTTRKTVREYLRQAERVGLSD